MKIVPKVNDLLLQEHAGRRDYEDNSRRQDAGCGLYFMYEYGRMKGCHRVLVFCEQTTCLSLCHDGILDLLNDHSPSSSRSPDLLASVLLSLSLSPFDPLPRRPPKPILGDSATLSAPFLPWPAVLLPQVAHGHPLEARLTSRLHTVVKFHR